MKNVNNYLGKLCICDSLVAISPLESKSIYISSNVYCKSLLREAVENFNRGGGCIKFGGGWRSISLILGGGG